MNHTLTDEYLVSAKDESTTRRAIMIREANGETLETDAEDAFHTYLTELRRQVKVTDMTVTVTLRNVFLAGYRMAEERRFK